MNGFAVHEALQLQEHTRSLPIVTITGTPWSSPFPVAAALTKPVATDQLVTTLFDALARGNGHQAENTNERVIIWICPQCKETVRQTQEPGHPMTSEMRLNAMPCRACAS